MMQCCDEGALRAYLEDDGVLSRADRASVGAHLAGCADCRATLENLRGTSEQAAARLSILTSGQAPSPQLALAKMRAALASEGAPNAAYPKLTGAAPFPPGEEARGGDPNRRSTMQTFPLRRSGPRRALFSGVAALLLVSSMVVFPSVRAAADQFLQSFRANSVVFLPVDANRLQQLEQTKLDPSSFFISKPQIVGTPRNDKVGSMGEAASLVGFKPGQPSGFPSAPTSSGITVHEQMAVQAQINVQTARDLLQTLGITDITLPDALGASPIKADVPALVQSSYNGDGYQLILVQGQSPTVTLPEGVQLSQLGEAGLRVLGMQPEQAKQMSQQIDWATTLVVPFPQGLNDVLRVQVGGAEGLLVTSAAAPRGVDTHGASAAVYWQQGDHFYVLEGSGPNMTPDALLVAANSVK